MLDALLNLPALLGSLIVMITFVVVGQAIRFASQKFLFQDKQEALQDATRTVFLAVNLLLGLFLSLSLNGVVDELSDIKDEVKPEAVAISDVYNGLGLFDTTRADDGAADFGFVFDGPSFDSPVEYSIGKEFENEGHRVVELITAATP